MKGPRLRALVGALLMSAAFTAAPSQAQTTEDPWWIPEWSDPMMPPSLTEPTWLGPELPAPTGGVWRFYGHACFDHELANISLQSTWGPLDDTAGRPPMSFCSPNPGHRDTAHRVIRGSMKGSDTWGVGYFGVTESTVDAVDVKSLHGWVRLKTSPVPAAAAATGLPADMRWFAVTIPWTDELDPRTHPDGPFFYQGAVAVSNRTIAGCTRELSCVKGVSAKRAGKYGKRVKVKRRSRRAR